MNHRNLTAFDPGAMPSLMRRGLALGATFVAALLCWLFNPLAHQLSFVWVWTRGYFAFGSALTWVFPYLLIGCAIILATGIFRRLRKKSRRYAPSHILRQGTRLALAYGVFEEIVYRWLAWFIVLTVMDSLRSVVESYVSTIVPIANTITLHVLSSHPGSHDWLFDGAIILASIRWTKGPEGCGRTLRIIIGWYVGVLMFAVLLKYGMLAAIATHIILYIAWFTTWAIIASFQRGSEAATTSTPEATTAESSSTD